MFVTIRYRFSYPAIRYFPIPQTIQRYDFDTGVYRSLYRYYDTAFLSLVVCCYSVLFSVMRHVVTLLTRDVCINNLCVIIMVISAVYSLLLDWISLCVCYQRVQMVTNRTDNPLINLREKPLSSTQFICAWPISRSTHLPWAYAL